MMARILLPAALAFVVTGCVALPLVAQLVAGAESVTRLCAVAELPGQTSACGQMSMNSPPR